MLYESNLIREPSSNVGGQAAGLLFGEGPDLSLPSKLAQEKSLAVLFPVLTHQLDDLTVEVDWRRFICHLLLFLTGPHDQSVAYQSTLAASRLLTPCVNAKQKCPRLENAPLVAFEAMAHRRPIVASTVGGLPELVSNGKNGFLCDRGDAEDFGRKLARLLKDPGLAQQLGSRGTRRLDELGDRDSHADRLVEMYGDVLSR